MPYRTFTFFSYMYSTRTCTGPVLKYPRAFIHCGTILFYMYMYSEQHVKIYLNIPRKYKKKFNSHIVRYTWASNHMFLWHYSTPSDIFHQKVPLLHPPGILAKQLDMYCTRECIKNIGNFQSNIVVVPTLFHAYM